MVKIVDLKGEWAALIGRLFISFGSIENITHACMLDWMKDPIYDHLKNMTFSRRVDLVVTLLSDQPFKKEFSEEFEIYFKSAKKLAEYRNLVAHNPLMLVLFTETGDFQEAITHVHKEEKFIDFNELRAIVEEIEFVENKIKENFNLSKFPNQQFSDVPSLTSQTNGTPKKGAPS